MEEIEQLKEQNACLLQALKQIRNTTLEEVALVCERVPDLGPFHRELASVIRSMKDSLTVSARTHGPDGAGAPEDMVVRYSGTGGLRDRSIVAKPDVAAGDSPAAVHNDWQPVMDEIRRATHLFPTWPTDPLHALSILGEEFGELTKAVLQTAYEPHKVKEGELRTEAVQTAAMALRFLASLDRYEFVPSAQHAQS
jgi:hypothetical protein